MNIEKVELDITKIEKITCPECSELINTSIISNSYMKEGELIPEEFTKLYCGNCFLEFCYISCAYCKKYLYMNIYQNALKYNGLNGFNIICRYKSCEKYFYFTECIKCKRAQKQKKYIRAGEIITCIYDDCKCEYIQSNCIIKGCTDLFCIEKPKDFKNFPIGIMDMHKKEIMFQKINCYYCCRPIVYRSNRNKKNKYWECQKVVCPYKNCKKIFNRMICPFCFVEIYVEYGWYEMGSKIKCFKCNKSFSKILCPSCCKINICKDSHFKIGYVQCGFQKCLKQNYMINCIYCRKLNIFKKKIPLKGQIIKCGYCKTNFNEILCPFCNSKIPFPFADFSFGKVYKCKYINCLKEFKYMICPNCMISKFSEDTKEGKKLKCHGCNTIFLNWACPFCYSSILDKNSTLKLGQMVTCPSKKCRKNYSFIQCSKCEKLIFSKENESILGVSVKCPYQGCGVNTLVIKCPICETKIIYKGECNNYKEGDNIVCQNCKNNFQFKKNKEIYNNKLTILEEIEGETIDFGVEEIDENYLMKEDLFFDKGLKKRTGLYPSHFIIENSTKELIKHSNNQILEECMVCHENLKESIFYPCGHRCVCYNCAVIIFTVYKKCPKCNTKAKCIIKKIYE